MLIVGPYEIFSLLSTVIIGVLVYRFSPQISDTLANFPIIYRARDANNPITYKIIGVLIIIYALVFPLLAWAIKKGASF